MPTTPSASDFEKQAQSKYGFADQINFSPKQVGQAVKDANTTIAGQAPRVIQEGQGAQKVLSDMETEAQQYGGMSAARLNDYFKKMHSSQTEDSIPVAGQIAQGQIKDVLQNAAPVTPHAPGVANQVLTDANALHGQSQDLNQSKVGGRGGAGRQGHCIASASLA